MTAARVVPLPIDQWDDETRVCLLEHLRRPELYLSEAPDAPPIPNILGLLAHHLPLGEATLALGEVLSDGGLLDPRHRELLVLRVAWRTASAYEWAQHERIGRDAGLTTAQLDAIPHGPEAVLWTPLERDLLAATDQLIDGFGIEPHTWERLAAHYDAAQLIEVLYVIAWYLCLALVMNGVGLQPDPPTEPIDAPSMRPQEV